ncbi:MULTISPECIES: FeoA family protein [unclassified Lebetimonas]|uniref:FeoA family protein n=1 Tax=unclassified Lebetimonas TaxID=2648158 RepID=UPI00046790D8|nr:MULTISPECIES: FeoA family protein [unclassified Lebetimonas]
MKLAEANRGVELKVVGFEDSLCEYSNTKLVEFNIDEGSTIIINTHFQSKLLVNVEYKERLIGFESARAVIMENGKRLAELSPGESADVANFEGGKEEYKRFKDLGIDIGEKVTVEEFLPEGEERIIRIEDEKVVPVGATKAILVKTEEGEKQIGLMKKREKGVISFVYASHGEEEVLDDLWIKEGSNIEVLYIKDIEKIPLMVTVKETGKKHVIGEGLADKIFVEYIK